METTPQPQRGPLSSVFQKRRQLERNLEHITQVMYRRNRELAETNKMLTLLRTIDALVLESRDPIEVICKNIAHAITEATDYPMVALLTKLPHSGSELVLSGLSIKEWRLRDHIQNIFSTVHVQPEDHWFQNFSRRHIVSLDAKNAKEVAALFSVTETQAMDIIEQLSVKTIYVIKLMAGHKLVGVIMAGFFNRADQLTQTDTLLLDHLSESVGVALDNKLLFEENRYIVHQLKETNKKLKAMDETKDDFIGMASHQLRTPLTSVKGYLSLVLDGDAGKITSQQRQLLTQAFISSQRMVFLIADLLNVSRLKTGKFIIELTPVNLADIITDEISQLKETAAARELTLEFHRPTHLPLLNLDETKTRQVVMNFLDNAVYYTPSGGHITAELTETPKSIELRVRDNGIGVPKVEQHHLFSKFYRAKNAQKARPDGTGLGLFMAKKVIIAQGGAIIFDSKEGEGSTFGFVFPKKPTPRPAQIQDAI
jgi:signal transduction histidine kinase